MGLYIRFGVLMLVICAKERSFKDAFGYAPGEGGANRG